jgi:peptidylprolyl isomerase
MTHVATNQQRREAERRRLQAQLAERRAREAARKRTTLIASIIGTVVLIVLVVVIVVVVASGGSGSTKNKNNNAAGKIRSSSPSQTTSAPALTTPTAPCAKPPKGDTAKFEGVTVIGGKDLKHAPTVKSLSEHAPSTVHCMDLVVGKGKAAAPTSTVAVQYTGVLYQNGQQFDSSWANGGKPISFPLTRVVPGFTQGIGGAGKVAPMREGGRRIMIIPAALGYGSQSNGSIPANSPLVFVVDLTKVTG